jgi:PBP1b-binding outer membrane lipoprotein LpoB
MAKIKLIPLILLITLLLTSCAKVTKTKKEIVKATVVDAYHRNQWVQTQTIIVNKSPIVTNIVHPEKNCITVKYANITETFDSKSLYSRYKDDIGTEIEVVLITTYFDDGTKKQKLEIGENNGKKKE